MIMIFLRVTTQSAIMVNPTEGEDWEFDYEEAWYGRVILFFTTTLKRKPGLQDIRVRLAFGQWYHKYDLSKGETIVIPCLLSTKEAATELCHVLQCLKSTANFLQARAR